MLLALTYDKRIKRFAFVYRKIDDPSYKTTCLIVVNTDDAFQTKILGKYQILDQSLKLKLLAPHDVKIK
jgi:hypothetical protein